MPPTPVSRDSLRSRRKRDVRAKTVSIKRMTERELQTGRELADAILDEPSAARSAA